MNKNYLRLLIPSIFLFLFSNISFSQTIKGKVVHAKTGVPVEFVNVVLKEAGSNTFIKGTVSDNDGAFIIQNISTGKYMLEFSSIGYKNTEKQAEVTSTSQVVDLGRVKIDEDATMLDEVNIVGMAAQMKFDIDKKVFNVDENISSTGGSASDILSNIPSVEVDNDGQVSLRGSSSVTVWINGKASGLSEDNRAQILEQLPAESIEKIEVITNPSAKFSPEGTGGIINIVLKKERAKGYFGSVQAGADIQGGYNASANINVNLGKVETYANIGFRHHTRNGGSTNLRTNDDGSFLNVYSDDNSRSNNVFARAGITYHVTDKDEISLSGFGMTGRRSNYDSSFYESDIPSLFNNSIRLNDESSKNFGGNLQLGYKHEFGENHNIDFTASVNTWSRNGSAKFRQLSFFDNYEVASVQQQDNKINPLNFELQGDYVNAFNENNKIEAGFKSSMSMEDSPVTTFSGNSDDSMHLVESLYNRFIYNRNIQAVYATYSGRINKFGYQAGLRGEYTDMTTKSLAYNQHEDEIQPYNTKYFDLFPSVFLTYEFRNHNELQFNYTRRISRPWGGQMNSFINISDSLNISYGNPELDPEYSNAYEINYLKTWENHLISIAAYYKNSDNVRQRIKYLNDNVMNSTWENVAHNRSAGTELVVKNSFLNMIDLTTTVNLFYYKLDSFNFYVPQVDKYVTGEGNSDFTWNVRLIANVVIPKWFSLQLTGRYNAKQVIAQGYREPSYSMDLGLRKSVKNFSFALTGRNLLNSRKHRTTIAGEGYSQQTENWFQSWNLRLSVTYGFGNMKMDRRKMENMNRENGEGESYDGEMEEMY